MYYFGTVETWTKDKTMVFVTRRWWDCTEFAYHGYNKLSEDFSARPVLGYVIIREESGEKSTIPLAHAWVEYLVDGKVRIFDMLKFEFEYIEYAPQVWGKIVYNFIRTEQFLRYLGFEAVIKSTYIEELATTAIIVAYRKKDGGEWIMYSGEFDNMRTEEYEWLQ